MENLDSWLNIGGALLAVGWFLVRWVPTGKNKDIIEGILSVLGKLIPNNSTEVDENGKNISHIERKRISRRKRLKNK